MTISNSEHEDEGVLVGNDIQEPSPEEYRRVDLAEEQRRFDEDSVGYEPPRSDIEWNPQYQCWDAFVVVNEPERESLPNPMEPETEELMEWDEAQEYLTAHTKWWRQAAERHGLPPCDFAPGAVAVWTPADLDAWIEQHRAIFEANDIST